MDALTFRRRSSHRRLAFMAAFTLLAGFITTGADLLAGPAPQAVAADTTESLRRAVATTTEQPVGNYSGTAADYGFTPSSTWAAGDPMTAVGGSVDYTNLLRYQLDPGRVIRFSFNGERATSAVSVDAGAVDQAPAGTVVTDAWFELADIDQTRAVFDFTASTIDGTVVTDISRIDVGLSFGGDGGGSHTVVDRGNGAFRVVFTGTGTGQGAGAVDSNGRLTMRMNDGTLLGGMRVALVSQTWNDFMAIDYRRVVTDLPADFGDAPDSYGTTAAANGAQHALVGLDATSGTAPLMLGASVDAEADGAPSALADADGTDEDALVAADAASVDAGAPSIDVAVRNDTAEAATLAGWLDLDGDGAFETGELVTAPVPASSGATTIELAFPAGTAGQSMLRLRLLPGAVSEPAATGAVVGGEVEDHLVTLTDLPYTCTTSTQFLAQGIPSQLIRMEQTAAGYTFEDVGPPAAQSYNAIGFNPVDGYLYASFGGPIYRVDPETGATENTGASFPAGTGIPSGAVSADGIYYVRRNPGPIHRIDLQNLDAGYTSITPTPNLPHGSDFTFAAGDSRYLWGKSAGTLTRIDLETGTAVAIAGVGTGFGVFGAAFAFGNGDLGFQNNSTGGVDRIRITSNGAVPTAELIGVIPGPSSGANDGASCIGSPTDLAVEKTAPATVDPSGQVSYDITVTNVGPGNSSGYVVRDEMPAGLTGIASSSPGVSISGSTVTIVGGALAAGESASYRITANGPPTGCVTNTAEVAGNEGDPVASNDSASATTCFGDQPADFGDAPSTFGTTLAEDGPRHDVPQLDAATGTAPLMLGATVDVEADGTPSAAADGDGTDEDGLAAAALRRSAPVAEITVVNDTGETATLAGWLDLDGDGLFEAAELVTATVPAGSGSSTLSLAFPAATATGDVLSRFRLYPGEVAAPTPGGAAAGGEVEDHLVTLTTAPALTIAKSSDASAATRIGDTVTYTVTATNTGDADFTEAAPATVIDDLTGVLDDASFNDDATASAGAPTYAEPRLTWQGPLEVGASVTLTYSVTLTGAGDHVVENVAFAADCEPGTPCEPVTPPVPECVDGGTDPVTGLSCDVVSFAIPALAIAKSADHSVVSADGETVTYTVEATNTGAAPFTEERPAVVIDDLSGVLDDATLDVSSIAADRGDAPVYAEPRIQWSGALGVGETVTLTYAVTSTGAGDSRLVNVAFGPECDADDPTCAETPPVTPVCDPADADGLDPASGEPCDRVEIPMSNLSVSKDADPADGSTVVAGDEVTYSVSFTNTGSAPAAVDRWTDHLTGVLDDAAVTVQPVASSDALVASAIADGMFTVSGSVPAGETVTVSYTVRVLADGARGDDVLANVVTPPGVEPPAECATGDALCTEHVVPEIVASKGVDPASGSTVAAGQVLTYTLTFGNEGAAAGGVDEVDHVGQLVDDAEITSAPIASDTALTVSEITDGQFAITGTLEPGQTVTVTYQATVLPDGQRGDDQLANFLLPPGTEPPTEPVCEPGDARCTVNPVRALLIEKSADATVVDADGQTVTYTVQATNVGAAAYTEALPAVVIDDLSGVLDDADLDVASLASDRGAAPSFAEPRIQWSGALGVGETVTLTYTVTFAAGGGDGTLVNVAFAPSCESGDPTCAETPPATPVCDPAVDGLDPSTGMPCDRVEIPTAQLTVSKDSDPADGSTVVAGDEVTYTLSFANAGTTAAPVEAWTDHLSGVLDDAEVTVQPVASSDALVASAIADDVFTVSGEVPAGETITVSYTVRVLADGARGDDVLANVVTPPGVEPPAECAADDALCTEHVVPEIVAAKSVDPASGSTVTAGQVLTYTLTFSNEGAAVGRVDAVDDLTHLLDDAEVSAAPVASDAALTVSEVADGRFGITGELQPGQTATVTYQATVLPDGARGDDVLGNFLLEPGEEPPAEPVCEDGAEDCTVNPVPEIVESKGVDPASGTTVEAGQVLTYTLTFGNDGAAAGEVDAVDDLTHLLDDAVISAAPVASDEALSVTEIQDGRLGVTGTLDPGQIVTVTYQATVLPVGSPP